VRECVGACALNGDASEVGSSVQHSKAVTIMPRDAITSVTPDPISRRLRVIPPVVGTINDSGKG
jgi:hypothetical protein